MPASGGCSNDRRHRFSSGKMGRKIDEDEVGHGPARLDRRAPPMRLEHDIVHVSKRPRNVRLVRKYVQTCPAQTPLGERGNQRGLVDALPRATLIRTPAGPSAFNTGRLTTPRVVEPPLAATTRKSESLASCSRSRWKRYAAPAPGWRSH